MPPGMPISLARLLTENSLRPTERAGIAGMLQQQQGLQPASYVPEEEEEDDAYFMDSMADGDEAAMNAMAPKGIAAGADLGMLSPQLLELTKQMVQEETGPPTREDKGLALAKMGFAMAASDSPHPLQAFGQGASYGIDSLQKMRQDRALQRLRQAQAQGTLLRAMGTRTSGMSPLRKLQLDREQAAAQYGEGDERVKQLDDQIALNLRPPRDAAIEQKIDMIVGSAGYNRENAPKDLLERAQGIAAGRYVPIQNPDTLMFEVVDVLSEVPRKVGTMPKGWTPPPEMGGASPASGGAPSGAPSPMPTAPPEPVPAPQAAGAPSAVPPGIEPKQATGLQGLVKRGFNIVTDSIGAGLAFPKAQEATEALTTARSILISNVQNEVPGRPSNFTMQDIIGPLAIEPNSVFMGSDRAKIRAQQTSALLDQWISNIEKDVLPGPYKPDIKQSARQSLQDLYMLRDFYDNIESGFNRSKTGRKPLEEIFGEGPE